MVDQPCNGNGFAETKGRLVPNPIHYRRFRKSDSHVRPRMKLCDVISAFEREVTKPTDVRGDSWGVDATTEDITRLIETPPDQLIAQDFLGYLGYCTTGGDADLLYLFPPILRIWEEELRNSEGRFTQYFHEEICRTNFIERALSSDLREVVIGFMIRALSERIGSEHSLRVAGKSTTHDWFGYFASFGVYSKAVDTLWNKLWTSTHPGHVIAILQYLSCLLYEEDNPVFSPRTCIAGGGAPELWGFDSVGFDESWKAENLAYLEASLGSSSVREWLARISAIFPNQPIGELAKEFTGRLDANPAKVDLRCEALVLFLGTPSDVSSHSWKSVGA